MLLWESRGEMLDVVTKRAFLSVSQQDAAEGPRGNIIPVPGESAIVSAAHVRGIA
uniref:Uncharacterized protein n=1 Tax=Thermosporothrix sp. COM3 TaxID=2490863 RepID=A0A455SCP4_9CHLR|nr:hypothetical protein KTC_00010 [Thermosporothrix sp. COM3]